MHQAEPADTTNVVHISTYLKRDLAAVQERVAERFDADPVLDSNADLMLLMAICTALHSGNQKDRAIYLNVRWSLAKMQERLGDGRGIRDAFFILNAIEGAAAR